MPLHCRVTRLCVFNTHIPTTFVHTGEEMHFEIKCPSQHSDHVSKLSISETYSVCFSFRLTGNNKVM